MLLAIDVGNTHTSFSLIGDDGECGVIMRFASDKSDTSYGYALKLSQALELEGYSITDVDSAIISSVVPTMTSTIKDGLVLLGVEDILVVGAGVKSGLLIRIDDPGTIAADLVATAVGAKDKYPLPCIIVDMGTATTVSAVDKNGAFVGVAILPGVGISLEALASKTSLLPLVDMTAPKSAICKNTTDCIRSGLLYGAAGAVDGMIDRFLSELGDNTASIVSTGGFASTITPLCTHEIIYDESLLLYGLGVIKRKNARVRK